MHYTTAVSLEMSDEPFFNCKDNTFGDIADYHYTEYLYPATDNKEVGHGNVAFSGQ